MSATFINIEPLKTACDVIHTHMFIIKIFHSIANMGLKLISMLFQNARVFCSTFAQFTLRKRNCKSLLQMFYGNGFFNHIIFLNCNEVYCGNFNFCKLICMDIKKKNLRTADFEFLLQEIGAENFQLCIRA